MKRTLKYKANWLSRMTFILFGLFFLHSNLGAFLSQIEIGNNVGVFEYSLELEDDFSGQVVECSFPDSYSSFSRVSELKNAHIKGVEVATKTSTNASKHSFKYAKRVRTRALQDPVSHNFPYSFDDAILETQPLLKNNGYKIFQKAGTMNSKNGVFEIGLTKNGVIDHRFFRPY